MTNDFDDLMGQFFEAGFKPGVTPNPQSKAKPEKGLPWDAKLIDGIYYIPLSQVADLLKQNDVLPAVCKGIEARVQAQADRKKMGI